MQYNQEGETFTDISKIVENVILINTMKNKLFVFT